MLTNVPAPIRLVFDVRNDCDVVKHIFPFASTTTIMNPVVVEMPVPKFPSVGKPVVGGTPKRGGGAPTEGPWLKIGAGVFGGRGCGVGVRTGTLCGGPRSSNSQCLINLACKHGH